MFEVRQAARDARPAAVPAADSAPRASPTLARLLGNIRQPGHARLPHSPASVSGAFQVGIFLMLFLD